MIPIHKKVPVFFVVVLVILWLPWFFAREAMAREPTDEITVWSEFFPDEEEFLPESQFSDQAGGRYWLKSCQMVSETIPERRKKVEKTVVYESVGREEEIPEWMTLTIQDKITGFEVTDEYPLTMKKKDHIRWLGDFSFTAVFHSYDSDYYELSKKRIPFNSQKPELNDCEPELLQEIGVSPEEYRILSCAWSGEPYRTEEGELCRNALITGERRVANFQVTYGGEAVLKETTGKRYRMIYRSVDAESQGWYPAKDLISEPGSFLAATDKSGLNWLTLTKTKELVISILFIIILIILTVWGKRRSKGRNTQRKEKVLEQ